MSPLTNPSKRTPARAIADVSSGLILATVEIAAPPERVFQALTSSDDVTKWWGSEDMYRTTSWEADVRVGGRWRSAGVGNDGSAFTVEGEFLAVDPPNTLVLTWKPSWEAGLATTVTYQLEPIPAGTRLTVRHEGFSEHQQETCRDHGQGWERVLGWLDGYIAGLVEGSAASLATAPAEEDSRKAFVLKLHGPRKTFAFDMTAEERAVMIEHAQYLAGHMSAGRVVVYGPVNDPSGPYGLGVARVADEMELAALTSNDPAVLGIPGAHYEVAPMLRLVTRQ